MRKIFILFLAICPPVLASYSASYDQVAHRLELIRNQIELTIVNHASLASDLARQDREFIGMNVFLRIPLASQDLKRDSDLLESIRQDWAKASAHKMGFKLKKIAFTGSWKVAPQKIPHEITFDDDYRIPEEQVVDRRELKLEIQFDEALPLDPNQWLQTEQSSIRRLLVPRSWSRKGKRLIGRVWIYRYREMNYPQLLAPDLSQYLVPSLPKGETQTAAFKRIQKYREDIVRQWPKAEPFTNNLRLFARNDARMNFYMKHVKLSH